MNQEKSEGGRKQTRWHPADWDDDGSDRNRAGSGESRSCKWVFTCEHVGLEMFKGCPSQPVQKHIRPSSGPLLPASGGKACAMVSSLPNPVVRGRRPKQTAQKALRPL